MYTTLLKSRPRFAFSRTALRSLSPRLLLALKAAIAVGLAWVIAPLMPGVINDYPYYAPLGALLVMHSTLAVSAKFGLQILAGMILGIVLAAGMLFLGPPNVFSISLVVAVAVLVGSFRWLGVPGKEYLPIAALFVLIVGGQDAEDYSIGYLVQMTVGVGVGLGVNLLIVPPLTIDSAVQSFSRFRISLAKHLDDVGAALVESWPPEREDWANQTEVLSATAGEVRAAIHEADDSRKGNPRALRHRRNLHADFLDLAALENISFHIRDLTEILAGGAWGKPFPVDLPADLCPPLSEAMNSVAVVLMEWDSKSGDTAALDDAGVVLDVLMSRLDERRGSGADSVAATGAIVIALRRIVAAVRVRVEGPGG